MNTRWKQSRIIILITSGFEEESTVICLKRFRSAGLGVELVGLTARPVVGAHGLVVRPDSSLEDLDDELEFELLIVPGYEKSVEKLLADPRFHRLFRTTVNNRGHIGIMRAAEKAFRHAGLAEILSTPQCLRQGKIDANTFSRILVGTIYPA